MKADAMNAKTSAHSKHGTAMTMVNLEVAEALPEWVNDTPPDNQYFMAVSSELKMVNLETVQLSREEYISLKEHLCALRGYCAPTASGALDAMRASNDP